MQVSLTPDLERFIERQVLSGRYQSANEVVRAALKLLEDRDRTQAHELETLRQKVAAGVEQLDRNDVWTLPQSTQTALREIEERGRERLRKHSLPGA